MSFSLESDKMNILKWYVDASHHIHDDFRSHTRATMTMRKGEVYNNSISQRLNTKSNKESKLVAVGNLISQG